MRNAGHVPVSYVLPDWVRSPRLPLLVGHELRAVFGTFVWVFLALIGCTLFSEQARGALVSFLFTIGCVAVGATAFGHDFAHRTLTTTFAQPFPRDELWRIRMKIAFGLTLALAVAAAVALNIPHAIWMIAFERNGAEGFRYMALASAIPFVTGICIAPWITLVCRSALAGTVFPICFLFGLVFASRWAASLVPTESSTDLLTIWIFAMVFGASSAAAFWDSRRRFARLEVIETQIGGFSIVGKRSVSVAVRERTTRTSRWRQLLLKEIRLQAITLVPVIGMIVTAVQQPREGGFSADIIMAATLCWAAAICVIIGSVGSAEERQLGIIETQGLLPMRRSIQWAMKIMVLQALALLIAVILPRFMSSWFPEREHVVFPDIRWCTLAALGLVSTSLYISSCSRTTIKAVLISIPFACALLATVAIIAENEHQLLSTSSGEWSFIHGQPLSLTFDNVLTWREIAVAAPYLCAPIVMAILLGMAGANHFSTGQSRPAWVHQVLVLLAAGAVSVTLCVALSITAASQ